VGAKKQLERNITISNEYSAEEEVKYLEELRSQCDSTGKFNQAHKAGIEYAKELN
jgi:hypothetical protein